MQKKKILTLVVALLLAGGYWVLENKFDINLSNLGKGGQSNKVVPADKEQAGDYERLTGCALIEHRSNDGDSFHVRHGNDEHEFRLYFVDAPESSYKTYRGGDNNGARLGHQGRYFGGLSIEQTTAIGTEAKKFTASLLKGRPFTVYTKWQPVFDSGRSYCFVELPDSATGERFLSEQLVAQGLARIYTEGAAMPGGSSKRNQEDKLKTIERSARGGKVGAWRFSR